MGEPPVARVWTARSQESPEAESVGFAEVMGVPTGGVLMAVGAVSAGPVGGAGQLSSSGCAVMRAAAMHGSPSGEILGMLGGSIDSEAPGASASGLVVSFHSASGALETATAGNVALAVLGREGRFQLDISQTPPVGGGRSAPPSRLRLALPGDRIALLAGHVLALADPDHAARVQSALAVHSGLIGAQTCHRLLSLVSDDHSMAAVALLDVVDGPSEDG